MTFCKYTFPSTSATGTVAQKGVTTSQASVFPPSNLACCSLHSHRTPWNPWLLRQPCSSVQHTGCCVPVGDSAFRAQACPSTEGTLPSLTRTRRNGHPTLEVCKTAGSIHEQAAVGFFILGTALRSCKVGSYGKSPRFSGLLAAKLVSQYVVYIYMPRTRHGFSCSGASFKIS